MSSAASREQEIASLYSIAAVVVLVIVTATFGAIIAAFIWRSFNPYLWSHLEIPWLLWVTTIILAASSYTYEQARRKLLALDQPGAFRLLKITLVLALLFLVGQTAAWLQVLGSPVVLARDKHTWFIFLFCALHGLHIVAGIAGLSVLLWRTREPASGPTYQMTTRAASKGMGIFWHYLTGLWILLFALLLAWRR